MALRHLAAAVATCAATVALSAPLAREDAAAFTADIARALQQRSGAPVKTLAPLSLQVGTAHVDLRRLFDGCHADAGTCDANADMFVKGSVELRQQAHARIDPAALRLIVRRTEAVARPEFNDASGADVETETLAPGLLAIAVVDTPNSMLFVRHGQLAALGMTHEQLFARARANLRATLKPLAAAAPPIQPNEIGALQGGDYEIGRLATPADWAALAAAQHGALVVSLPANDIAMYAASDDPRILKALSDASRDEGGKVANPLAPGRLLRWASDRWEPVAGY